jgi:hypothetical protein
MKCSLDLQERRQKEFEAANTKAEVDALMDTWAAEDRAMADAKSVMGQQLADLSRRLARIEQVLGPGGEILIEAIGEFVGRTLRKSLDQLRSELEQKLADVERKQLRFLGVHEPGRQYVPGNMVVRSGGLWCCLAMTTEQPGRSSCWQLCVKSGEIAKVS